MPSHSRGSVVSESRAPECGFPELWGAGGEGVGRLGQDGGEEGWRTVGSGAGEPECGCQRSWSSVHYMYLSGLSSRLRGTWLKEVLQGPGRWGV